MTSKEAITNIKVMLERTGNLVFYKEEIEAIKKDLKVLEIIKKYSFLDLSVLADYDDSEFDEYFDDWHDTTNELDRKEFELLKEYLENE